jgi:hypothetical protein
MATAFTYFYDDLMPLVPGCPMAMANKALLRAAQEWCEKTLCWRAWLDDVTTLTDENTYDFNVVAGQEVVQLLRATLDGQDILVMTPDSIPANWRTSTAWSDRTGIFTQDASSFVLVPTPAADLIVQTEVALRPTNTATGVEDAIFAAYANEIATGAAARLHAMPGKPYTYAASTARKEFQDAIATTASEVWHAFSRAPQRVRASFL